MQNKYLYHRMEVFMVSLSNGCSADLFCRLSIAQNFHLFAFCSSVFFDDLHLSSAWI